MSQRWAWRGSGIVISRCFGALWLLMAASCLLVNPVPAAASQLQAQAVVEHWDFQVLLDDRLIGTHRFERTVLHDGGYRLVSKASFAVKLLFATVYSYQHRAEEHWYEGCLQRLESQTNDNGRRYRVQAQPVPGADGLQIRADMQQQYLPGCVFSFAYWDRAMLDRVWLLNVQDGEHVQVLIQEGVSDTITVRAQAIAARRYELRSEKLAIDLWYSSSGRWLALESRTPRGQKLRYQLQ